MIRKLHSLFETNHTVHKTTGDRSINHRGHSLKKKSDSYLIRMGRQGLVQPGQKLDLMSNGELTC